MNGPDPVPQRVRDLEVGPVILASSQELTAELGDSPEPEVAVHLEQTVLEPDGELERAGVVGFGLVQPLAAQAYLAELLQGLRGDPLQVAVGLPLPGGPAPQPRRQLGLPSAARSRSSSNPLATRSA